MRTLLISVVIMVGCSKQASTPEGSTTAPVVIMASNERGSPQIDYSGPDSLNYRYSLGSFTFQIGNWATSKGKMKLRSSNDLSITIQSRSDKAYDLQLWGLSTNNNSELEEEKLKQTIHVPPGDQKLTFERFVIYTYDFAKR